VADWANEGRLVDALVVDLGQPSRRSLIKPVHAVAPDELGHAHQTSWV
jgi:hypothetical protein